MRIRVGSRESKLAVVQANMVIESIRKYHPEIEVELVTMKTTGDMILDRTLDKIGGKGLFVKELDRALLEKEVDITVHSFKDMPMEIDERLPIVATSKREDPRDVLILPKGKTEIEKGKPLGCASKRRTLQLQKLWSDIEIKPIRGNVLTRLQKLDSGEYSGLILAYAGIKRLGLEERISRVFEPDEIIPAGCQGVVVVQARKGEDTFYLEEFKDQETEITSTCERAFVRTLDGGCSSPVAAYGVIDGDAIHFTGLYVDEESNLIIEAQQFPIKDREERAIEMALEMKKRGAIG